MILHRPAAARGRTETSWLKSYHTFSFGEYEDPEWMDFSVLRVINDDWVAPGQGFATHGHRDMEIITYVLEGVLEHKDSLGNGSLIRPGEVQRMSAGTGIRHSEFNPSARESVHLLQMWVLPERRSIAPSYEQKSFAPAANDAFRLVASPDGREGSVTLHQDVTLSVAHLSPGARVNVPLASARRGWVQMARGEVTLNGLALKEGDGAGIEQESMLEFSAQTKAEILLFDLP